jgi:uncharacterized protein (TIGR02117 family)
LSNAAIVIAAISMKAPLPGSSRPVRRGLFWAGLVALVLPLSYICAVLAGGYFVTATPRDAGLREYRIGLIAGPLHYDLMIPLHEDIRPRFAFAQAAGVPVQDPTAEWLRIGWGAGGVYTSAARLSDMALPQIWRAASGDSAVMRLDTVGRILDFDQIPLISLSQAEIHALIDAVLGALDGTDALPLPGHSFTDAFFPARGRFHLFNTCNVWLGDALRAAGLPFGRWTPFPQSIRLSLAHTGLARD